MQGCAFILLKIVNAMKTKSSIRYIQIPSKAYKRAYKERNLRMLQGNLHVLYKNNF